MKAGIKEVTHVYFRVAQVFNFRVTLLTNLGLLGDDGY